MFKKNSNIKETNDYCDLCNKTPNKNCKICKSLITKNIVPSKNNTYSIGSTGSVWNDLYIGSNFLL